MQQRNRTLDETVYAIYEAVKQAPTPLSRLEICRAVGRKKTPHMITIIEEMVRKGWLRRVQSTFHNGAVLYLYAAAEFAEPTA